MICQHCHYEVGEDEAKFDQDMPANAYHEDCYDEAVCECGHKSWDKRGFCIDCLISAEEKIKNGELVLESINEDNYFLNKYGGDK